MYKYQLLIHIYRSTNSLTSHNKIIIHFIIIFQILLFISIAPRQQFNLHVPKCRTSLRQQVRPTFLVVPKASLVVPRFQRKTLGGRAFPVAEAQAWNSLPSHVTSSSSLASFKRSLKTELFLRSYVEAWYRLMLHVTFLTLLRALEVNIDLCHVNHIRYYCFPGSSQTMEQPTSWT